MARMMFVPRTGQCSLYTSLAELTLIGGSADGRWDIPGYNYGMSQFQEFASRFPLEAAEYSLHQQHGYVSPGKVVYIARRDRKGAYFGICVIKRSATERPDPKLLEQCLGQIATAVARGLHHVAMPKLCCGSSEKYLSFQQMVEMVQSHLGHPLQEVHLELHCGKRDVAAVTAGQAPQNVIPFRQRGA